MVASRVNDMFATDRALLGLDEKELVAMSDASDAMAELVNMLAGGVKQRVARSGEALSLGIPRLAARPPKSLAADEIVCALDGTPVVIKARVV